MVKKVILMVAIAGAVCLTAVYLRRPAPVSDFRTDSAQAPIGPAKEGDKTKDGGRTVLVAPSPHPSVAAEAIKPQPTRDEVLARLSEAIVQGLNSTNEDVRDMVLTNLLLQLVALDPAAAGRLAEAIAPEAGREEVLRRVAQAWGDKDPVGALAWAAQLPDAEEQRSTLADVTFQIAQSDPAKAIDTAQQYHLGDGNGDVLANLAQQWADKDLSAAMAWAGNQPAGVQRDQIMARIAFVESQTAPAEAGVLAVTQISPGQAQEEAVISVLHQWALKDLPGVSAWVKQFPEGPVKERALAELAGILRYQSEPSGSAAPENAP